MLTTFTHDEYSDPVDPSQDNFSWVTWPSADWRELEIQVKWRLLKGRWECVGLAVDFADASKARPLQTADLRGITLGRLLEEAAEKLSKDLLYTFRDPDDKGPFGAFIDGLIDATEREQRSPRVSPETLQEVARIYREAKTAPTKAVQEHFGIEKSRAARWVWLCRNKYHLLPPTEQGRARGNRKREDT
jgi:hypothetical protein